MKAQLLTANHGSQPVSGIWKAG